jgi:hypothetical protein
LYKTHTVKLVKNRNRFNDSSGAAGKSYRNFMLSSNAGWAGRIGGTGLTETTGTTLGDAADDDDDDDDESDPSSPSFDEAAGLDLTRGGEGLRFGAVLDPSTASRCADV